MLARVLIVIGVILVLVGVLLSFKVPLPFGKLPGDFRYTSEDGTVVFFFPLTTGLLLSGVITFILWVLSRWR